VVAKPFSHDHHLQLVLYPGVKYKVEGPCASAQIVATDDTGKLDLTVNLSGWTAIIIKPVGRSAPHAA